MRTPQACPLTAMSLLNFTKKTSLEGLGLVVRSVQILSRHHVGGPHALVGPARDRNRDLREATVLSPVHFGPGQVWSWHRLGTPSSLDTGEMGLDRDVGRGDECGKTLIQCTPYSVH